MSRDDCLKCPYSLLCLVGDPEYMALVVRYHCDHCRSQWVRQPVPGGFRTFRCEDNHIGLPNPDIFVCPDCTREALLKQSLNDDARAQWIDNDEGLYDMWRRSGLSKREFIRRNRLMLTESITNVLEGKKPAHYLKYGG